MTDFNPYVHNRASTQKKKLCDESFLECFDKDDPKEKGIPNYPIVVVFFSPFFEGKMFRGDDALKFFNQERFFKERNLTIPPLSSRKEVIKDIFRM